MVVKLPVGVPSEELVEIDTGQKSIVLDIEAKEVVFSVVLDNSSPVRELLYQFPT